MGIVWEAEDTSLSRNVAIKVLPEMFAGDPERMARFEREARLLASLDHPNIAAIHDLAESDGIRYLVLELVPGRTLAEIIDSGPLPLDEALPLALQIAEGLEAAHEVGVIHRDLKPANIKVTPEDRVKILDFGLAKALEGDAAAVSSQTDLSHSPTMTSDRTRAGVILGTAAYMSPEQARGKPVDRRGDIWAFGCVLFEMLTGRKLFDGETVSDMLAAVLRAEPEWDLLPNDTPPSVHRLLYRCLQRDPRERLRDIGEARIAVQLALAGQDEAAGGEIALSAAAPPSPGASALLKTLLAGGGVLAGALLAVAVLWGLGASLSPPEPALRRFRLEAGPSASLPVISPDGRRVVYADAGSLWIRDLDELEPREIPDSEEARAFWSPDSNWIGFDMGGRLWKFPANGGNRMAIGPLKGSIDATSGGAAWSADGRIVFTTGSSGLMEIPARGGDPVSLLEPGPDELDFHNVSPLPGGRGFLFVVHGEEGMGTIAACHGNERKYLLQLPGENIYEVVYSPTGHLLYRQRGANIEEIWAVSFSLSRLEVTGEPFLVVDNGASPSVSADGTLVHLSAYTGLMQLAWVDRNGNRERVIGRPLEGLVWPALSPDETRVAVCSRQGEEANIWIMDSATGSATRLTFSDSRDGVPTWTANGEQVVYMSLAHGDVAPALKILPADGSGEPRDLGPGGVPSVSADGRHVAYMGFSGGGNLDLFYVPLDGQSRPEPMLEETEAVETWPRISPDGQYLAYQSDQSGRHEIYLTRFPDATGRWQVSNQGGQCPRWARSGDSLFFLRGNDLMEVEITTQPALRLGTPRKLFSRAPTGQSVTTFIGEGYDVTGDGERFVMVENAEPDRSHAGIVVVQNWLAAVSERD
jgi:serine/threonine-protein kinase